MARTTLFGALDDLFREHLPEIKSTGNYWGSFPIEMLELPGCKQLRCAMDEEQAYWYELVLENGQVIRVNPQPEHEGRMKTSDKERVRAFLDLYQD